MRINSIIFFLLIPLFSYSKQIEVCPECSIKTIKEGILATEDFDTLLIRPAIYKEYDLVVDHPLTLLADEGTVLDGEHKGTLITFRTNHFSIEGFTLKNVGLSYIKEHAAIHVEHSDSFKILRNQLEEVFFGCLIEKSHYGEIAFNSVRSQAQVEASSGNGTHLWHCSNMKIHDNYYTGLRDGIYFEFVTESEVYNNVSNNNLRYGLHFMFSNNDHYHHNEFTGNGAGVAVMFSKFIKMNNNTFKKNWGTASYGLLLKEIYDADITDNRFEENTVGINIEGSNRITYSNNQFVQNGWALKIVGACYDNQFTLNNFIANSFDLSYNTKINSNVFDKNYWSEYNGYDRNKDGYGDVPYRPVKLFSYIVNQTPEAIVLLRSLFIFIINFSEKVSPIFTPDNLVDANPLMHAAK